MIRAAGEHGALEKMKKLAALDCGNKWDVNWRDTNHFFYNGLHMVPAAASGRDPA